MTIGMFKFNQANLSMVCNTLKDQINVANKEVFHAVVMYDNSIDRFYICPATESFDKEFHGDIFYKDVRWYESDGKATVKELMSRIFNK
jgi:hypothetical protein